MFDSTSSSLVSAPAPVVGVAAAALGDAAAVAAPDVARGDAAVAGVRVPDAGVILNVLTGVGSASVPLEQPAASKARAIIPTESANVSLRFMLPLPSL
jgi:hypothetical protein